MARLVLCILAAVGAIAFIPAPASAASTLNVPGDYATIQAAINAASPGDTVLVAPGTYAGPVDFQAKAITLASTSGRNVTTISGGSTTPVVTINANAGEQPVLNGFTITGGSNGGVTTSGGPALIENNSITNNAVCNNGGGVDASFSSATIRDNVISGNYESGCSGDFGGGVSIGGAGSVQLLHNVISGNSATEGGGVSLFAAAAAVVDSNVISDNNTTSGPGGGIWVVNGQSQVSITNNVITGNRGFPGGGIDESVPFGDRGAFIFNNTLVGNVASPGSAINMEGFDNQANIVNNILESSTSASVLNCDTLYQAQPPVVLNNDAISTGGGTAYAGSCSGLQGKNGNFSADPQFVNGAAGDYHLQFSSPAIDAGANTSAPTLDIEGTTRPLDGNFDGVAVTDLGAFELAAKGIVLAELATMRAIVSQLSDPTLVSTLDGKLVDAENAINANNPRRACRDLSSFVRTVKSQTGTGIDPATAATLISDASTVHQQLQCK